MRHERLDGGSAVTAGFRALAACLPEKKKVGNSAGGPGCTKPVTSLINLCYLLRRDRQSLGKGNHCSRPKAIDFFFLKAATDIFLVDAIVCALFFEGTIVCALVL